MQVFPILLAGGMGKRLWPLSRPEKPKQFLRLISQRSLFQDTLLRADVLGPAIIIGNAQHDLLLSSHISELALRHQPNLLYEAKPYGTAFSIALGCLQAMSIAGNKGDAYIVVMPCDHYIQDEQDFKAAVQSAMNIVPNDIAVFGVKPQYAYTGYGYLEVGQAIEDDESVYRLKNFKEKPNREQAKQFLDTGQYLWNMGIVCGRASKIIQAFECYSNDILGIARRGFEQQSEGLLSVQGLSGSTQGSFDYQVLEHLETLFCVRYASGWSDMGSWSSLVRHRLVASL